MSNCTDAAAADAGAAAAAVRLFSFWALFRRLVAGIIPKCAPSVLRQDQSDSVTVLPLSRGFGLFSELFAYLAGIHRTSSSMESSTAFHSWRIVPGWITISWLNQLSLRCYRYYVYVYIEKIKWGKRKRVGVQPLAKQGKPGISIGRVIKLIVYAGCLSSNAQTVPQIAAAQSVLTTWCSRLQR